MYIDPGILAGIITVAFTGMIAFATWLVRQITRHSELLARVSEHQDNQDARHISSESRIEQLETWRTGVDFGRAVEKAVQERERKP